VLLFLDLSRLRRWKGETGKKDKERCASGSSSSFINFTRDSSGRRGGKKEGGPGVELPLREEETIQRFGNWPLQLRARKGGGARTRAVIPPMTACGRRQRGEGEESPTAAEPQLFHFEGGSERGKKKKKRKGDRWHGEAFTASGGRSGTWVPDRRLGSEILMAIGKKEEGRGNG